MWLIFRCSGTRPKLDCKNMGNSYSEVSVQSVVISQLLNRVLTRCQMFRRTFCHRDKRHRLSLPTFHRVLILSGKLRFFPRVVHFHVTLIASSRGSGLFPFCVVFTYKCVSVLLMAVSHTRTPQVTPLIFDEMYIKKKKISG